MAKEEKGNTMKLAEILSDLVSLRICDPAAALALVSARPNSSSLASNPTDADEDDPDLKRAKDLVELHYSVKEANRRAELARDLTEARAAVDRAVDG